MQVNLQDLSRVVEIQMQPRERYDTPSLITEHLRTAQAQVLQYPRSYGVIASFTLRGVDIKVGAKSHIPSMKRDFQRALQGCILPEIGPRSKRDLSKKDRLNDDIVETANKMLEDAPGLELRPLKEWGEPFLKDEKNLSVFDRAMLIHSTRLGRMYQVEMDRPGFDPDDEEMMVQVAADAGLPMVNIGSSTANFDYLCHLFKYSVDRLGHEWHFRCAIAPLYVWTRSSVYLANIVRSVLAYQSRPVEHTT